MIVGHRGSRGKITENTLASIQDAKEHGLDAVEFDVRITKDNRLVLHHDSNLERIYGKQLIIKNHTLLELKNATKNHPHPLTTLEETLQYLDNFPVYIELKDHGSAKSLMKIIETFPNANILGVLSFNSQDLNDYQKFGGTSPTFFITTKSNFLFSVGLAKKCSASGIVTHRSTTLLPLHIFRAKHAGLSVMIYPVNSKLTKHFITLLGRRIHIETDYPQKLT